MNLQQKIDAEFPINKHFINQCIQELREELNNLEVFTSSDGTGFESHLIDTVKLSDVLSLIGEKK